MGLSWLGPKGRKGHCSHIFQHYSYVHIYKKKKTLCRSDNFQTNYETTIMHGLLEMRHRKVSPSYHVSTFVGYKGIKVSHPSKATCVFTPNVPLSSAPWWGNFQQSNKKQHDLPMTWQWSSLRPYIYIYRQLKLE